MSSTLLARTRLMVIVLAAVGLLAGVFAAAAFTGRGERFTAEATLAMLPGPEVPLDQASNFWEVLNRGQATRSAAIVLGNDRWLDAAASTAGVPKSELTLAAGALPDTTLITVTMQANSANVADVALESVLTSSSDVAATVSGPFKLESITSPDSGAQSMSPDRMQMFGALGIAGLSIGAGAGLLVSRAARGRSARRKDDTSQSESGPIASTENTDLGYQARHAEPAPVETQLR